MQTPETFHSDRQVAARYNVSRCTIWRWVERGQFPKPIKLSPGCTRWRGSALAAHEQSMEG
ncbi:helix-turn-helix transcriptional regulator [Desulfurivibrio sp. C05AmB]|uniref:helix-turn-helix transcriptional regulator n=1 Tax=Desulfurivibrio sp. C05AmB TaxID=3374371 RepID=UPI00376EC965